MAKEWTRKYTPPEQLNGGVQYENGHNPTVDTFNVPANNSFYAVEVANEANEKSDDTAAEVERYKSDTDADIDKFKEDTTSRVNELAKLITDAHGTLVSVNGREVLQVLYENGDYYYIDVDGSKKLLPMDRYEKRLISQTISETGAGVFTVPSGIASAIRVVCVGGGGKGGNGSNEGYNGGGGGSGHITFGFVSANAGEAINYYVAPRGGTTTFGDLTANPGNDGASGGNGCGGGGMAGGGGGGGYSNNAFTLAKGGNGNLCGGGGGGNGGYYSSNDPTPDADDTARGGNGGEYGGGGGGGGYNRSGSSISRAGGAGGLYGGNGGSSTDGEQGTDTTSLDVEYKGEGRGGLRNPEYYGNGGGGGGYGGNGGNGTQNYGGGGGGGYGGNGGNGTFSAGGGGGGYGCDGSDGGVYNEDQTRGGGGGGGGGYTPYNYGGGGNGGYGTSIGNNNSKYGDYGKSGVIVLTYYQNVLIPAEE